VINIFENKRASKIIELFDGLLFTLCLIIFNHIQSLLAGDEQE
jgi:hypothetical protein